MLNFSLRGNKAWWCLLGMCLGLMNAPAFGATYSTVFAFDLHLTSVGVVEGSGSNQGFLFGTTYDSSLTYGGSIYKVAMNGGAPQVVYQLKDTDGYNPQAMLLLGSDGYLYGTTHYGPRLGSFTSAGTGTIFRVGQDGTNFTKLHTFAASTTTHSVTGNSLNADGIFPDRALIESGAYLYGVTTAGGLNGSGVVFRLRKSDGLLDVLHHFAATTSTGVSSNIVNGVGEGAYPTSSLTLATNGRLYGVTSGGGANLKTTSSGTSGAGTIYSLNVDGTDFQTVYNFTALDDTAAVGANAIGVNPDGVQPNGNLLEVSSGVLVGTTSDGGTPIDTTATGYGTVFTFTVATRSLNTLHAFDNTTGATPSGSLVLDSTSGRVYGVTNTGSSTSTPVTLLGEIYSVNPTTANFAIEHALVFAEGSGPTGGLIKASNGDLFGTVGYGNVCTATSSSGYGAVFRYSLTTNASSSGYANCTVYDSDSGGGAFSPGFLWLLSALGLVPVVRRRLFGFSQG